MYRLTFKSFMAFVMGAIVYLATARSAMAGTDYTSQSTFENDLASHCGLTTVDFEDISDGTVLTGGEYASEGVTMDSDLGMQVDDDVAGATPNGAVGLWVLGGDPTISQTWYATFSDPRDAIGLYALDIVSSLEIEGYYGGAMVDSASFPGAGENSNTFAGVIFTGQVDEVWVYASSTTDGWGLDDVIFVNIDCFTDDDGDGVTEEDGDCDDELAMVYPGADEYCDGLDNDCDGDIDEAGAVDEITWYMDDDEDGYGDASISQTACEAPADHVANNTDCDDADGDQFPGADEYCNGEDDDCNSLVDEDDAVDPFTWYADLDNDGYGDPANSAAACSQPVDFVADRTDCDDADDTVYPDADEYCDGIDHDCDYEVNEPNSVDAVTVFEDTDGDGHGNADNFEFTCDPIEGYVELGDDCDDTNPDVCPTCPEFDDSMDNDCDGEVDESSGREPYFPDTGVEVAASGCACSNTAANISTNLIWTVLGLFAFARRRP